MNPSDSKIKAIVFDCFGVLATDGWLPFKSKHLKDKPELFAKATELNRMVDAGLESYQVFIDQVSKMSGLSRVKTIKEIEDNVPDEDLFNYIKEDLRPRYKLGMLSNSGANWLDDIFTEAQVKLFDAVVLSFEIGAIKPDPIMYETIAKRLGVKPAECIFIDDQERYCVGAREVGMQAVVYENPEKLKQTLDSVL